MFVRCFFALFVLLQLNLKSVAAAESREQRNEMTLSECVAKLGECDESHEDPVCGTDDQTYPTRCHLLRVQCSGHQVSLKYRGACKVCMEARKYARKHHDRNPMIFVPRCRKDGNYAATQCLGATGCWCSDSSGKPIENTSVRKGRPDCRGYKRSNRRRAPVRLLSSGDGNSSGGGGGGGGGSGGNHRPCSQLDRAAFNNHLIEVFRSEFLRSGQSQSHSDAAVLDWKFAQLDANANQVLDKQEVRELKKLVKRAVKPRRCGRAFGKYCDVNKDDRMSRLEWISCLAKDGQNNRNAAVDVLNSSPTPTPSSTIPISTTTRRITPHYLHTIHTNPNPNHDHTNTNIIGQREPESDSIESDEHRSQQTEYEDYENEDGEEDEDVNHRTIGMPSSHSASFNFPPSFYFLNSKTEPTNNESEGDANCWTDQAVALEDQSNNSVLYVPECMPDGRYQRVQCYRSTPYCWCVNEDTGKNIPDTSVKNKRPQCDEVRVVRTMKGCSEPRKTAFLKELKVFLRDQILSSIMPSSNNATMDDERIATLSFLFLDKNKNKSWERKEWKVFRELVNSKSNLRKCGKKLVPRYCDVNVDKKITLSEWADCLQSQLPESAPTAKPTQSNETATSRLLGSNPLEQYLKD